MKDCPVYPEEAKAVNDQKLEQVSGGTNNGSNCPSCNSGRVTTEYIDGFARKRCLNCGHTWPA